MEGGPEQADAQAAAVPLPPERSVHDGPDDLDPAVLRWREGDDPIRVLFVFAWLVVGGEETEVRLLAEAFDPREVRIDVVACFRKEGMPEQTHHQLAEAGVHVDTTPYALSFEDTVAYLRGMMAGYDVVVSCQNVADVYPALDAMRLPPPLIEHGGLVSEAEAGPKHRTARYVGVCRTIREAAARRMPGREHHALEIPSMVDLRAFDPSRRAAVRRREGVPGDAPLLGWIGRLDPKKRVEDFIAAAAIVRRTRPDARFWVIGGPDAFHPDYAVTLRAQAARAGLTEALTFLGDRADVPDLLVALDALAWLSRGEGMPHVIAEAGAASLAVVATPDNGALQQIEDGVSGLFVPHEDPQAVAAALLRLIEAPAERARLSAALRQHVARHYDVPVVVETWRQLLAEVVAEHRAKAPPPPPPLLGSPFWGGFEGSTHRRKGDRARLDMIAATDHDTRVAEDYAALAGMGILGVRDAVRWHLIETTPGRYDFASLDRQLAAAAASPVTVVWDLLHYGWPDDVDIWGPGFPDRFAAFALATARRIVAVTGPAPWFAPVNEISFLAWGGGDVAYMNPFAQGRGFELKVQLVRAALAAQRAIRAEWPQARFLHVDPLIHIAARPDRPGDAPAAHGHRQAQFQGWDMIDGRAWPMLGGDASFLDVVGINYYWNNQWLHAGPPIDMDHRLYRPLRALLAEAFERYGRPIVIAETGIEGRARPRWLAWVCAEVRAAIAMGVPVQGLCLYPVLDHHGWDDGRYCPNGLLQSLGGVRGVYAPLAEELTRQQGLWPQER